MDKFGIFNLLNSFATLYKNNMSDNGEQNTTQSQPAQDQKNKGGFDINSIISGLTKPAPSAQEKEQHLPPPPPLPLQNSMLTTIKSHDEFVKRVKQKQTVPKK